MQYKWKIICIGNLYNCSSSFVMDNRDHIEYGPANVKCENVTLQCRLPLTQRIPIMYTDQIPFFMVSNTNNIYSYIHGEIITNTPNRTSCTTNVIKNYWYSYCKYTLCYLLLTITVTKAVSGGTEMRSAGFSTTSIKKTWNYGIYWLVDITVWLEKCQKCNFHIQL